ncbi:MAG: glycoside hydrolase family 43 protein [Solobacterium sp.]|nr:glycoside hydrolase family 43 protein [Solobacterium sp.]
MKLNDIHIRDPFILNDEGVYYLYGTRGPTCWGEQDGIDGYVSEDLENWEGPFEVFHRPEGFWGDRCYWAPEVHVYKGAYYMFATFANSVINKKGTMILRADRPLGPYQIHSEGKITPEEWNCLDGTLYISKTGVLYMVFCHEWLDLVDGEMCYVQLSEDLKRAVSAPVTMFKASYAKPWVRPEPKMKTGDFFITDGPFMYRKKDGGLLMLWASYGEKGYAEALARSDSGEIDGNWTIDPQPLFDSDGGHGMIFADREGKEYLVLHQPNDTPNERPVLLACDLDQY